MWGCPPDRQALTFTHDLSKIISLFHPVLKMHCDALELSPPKTKTILKLFELRLKLYNSFFRVESRFLQLHTLVGLQSTANEQLQFCLSRLGQPDFRNLPNSNRSRSKSRPDRFDVCRRRGGGNCLSVSAIALYTPYTRTLE